MERNELIGLMRELRLAGMPAAYDDIMRAGTQHRRGPTARALSRTVRRRA